MGETPTSRGRLLVVTALWPTADMPSVGIFVEQRLRGVNAAVVKPRSYQGPMALRYLRLLWDALTARGKFVGVESHVLFPAGLIGHVAARLRRVPHVVYAHGADVRVTAHENRLYGRLASYVARHADAVVTNSQATAGLIREFGRDAAVIPPGVDLDRFKPSPRPMQKRVLYLGGMRYHKGYDRALGLANTLAGQKLREVEPSEVPALVAAHDVVLMPSRAEPFGLLAAEAIAAGRWVVAANVDGLREIITDGVNGSLVDGEAFAEAIQAVPNYDPFEIAGSVVGFGLTTHQERMAAMWRQVLARMDTEEPLADSTTTPHHRARTGRRYAGIEMHAAAGLHEYVGSLAAQELGHGARVLDLGAGSGALSARLLAAGYDVIAADLEVDEYAGLAPVHQWDASASTLPPQLAAETFDGVFAVEVLEHVENPLQALRNVATLLKPGGAVIASTPNLAHPRSRVKFFLTGAPSYFGAREYYADGHRTLLPDWLLRSHLSEAGFVEITITYAGRMSLPTKSRWLWRLVSPFLGWLQSKPRRDEGCITVAVAHKPRTADSNSIES